jgi:hypothetical protein
MAWLMMVFRVSPSAPGHSVVISCWSRSTAAGRAPSAKPAAANATIVTGTRDSTLKYVTAAA